MRRPKPALTVSNGLARANAGHFGDFHGEAINLSERGIGFKSREKLCVGDQVDLYLTIPRVNRQEFRAGLLQGACGACGSETDLRGLSGFGAVVDRFEAVAAAAQSWAS